jgi:hypothetical protein
MTAITNLIINKMEDVDLSAKEQNLGEDMVN